MSQIDRRNPRQKRSLERVESILEAASSLIAEQGGGGLKMAAVAQRAGITTGSIYQYFPNTTDIVRAIAESYGARFHSVIEQRLQQVQSVDDLTAQSGVIFDDFCEMYRNEPVLKEVGLATSLDKRLQEMDVVDSRRNADLLFAAFSPYVEASAVSELRQLLFLLCHLSGATIRLALSLDDSEGLPLLACHKKMFESRILELLSR